VKKLGFFKSRKLKSVLKKSQDGLTILIRKNPTVDSLASAYALARIAEHFHTNSKCYYSGTVHHKGLLNIMGSDIEPLPDVITDELSGTLALVDVVPSELAEDVSALIDIPAIIISHSSMATKDIKCHYKDIRANVETTSTIMVQYFRSLKVPIDSTIATMFLFAIRDRLEHIDHDLLLKLENPAVKSETFNDLAKALNNREIKNTYLLTNTGYIKDPSTLPKVCKYMLDLEGISTALVYAVDTSNIYVYATSHNIEINLTQVFKKAFGHCGNIIGNSSYASITIPLGLFGVITRSSNNIESRELMLDTIKNSISSRFSRTIKEGEGKLENE
jgi:nanoRNase/pAp phosphatase (c-di-AMP/oligoRNAs hydrolase)